MHSIRDFIDPGGRMLARRLEQLCSTLEDLGARLRGTIANAIGETLGGIVRDTAQRVLDDVSRSGTRSGPLRQPLSRRWNEPLYGDAYDQRHYWPDDDEVERDEESPATPPAPERLPTALSAGLQAASLWLRRWSGPTRLVTTLAVGFVAASVAYVGGPLAVVVLHLAGLATPFASWSDASGSPRFHHDDSA
jgi:hypothetical protein